VPWSDEQIRSIIQHFDSEALLWLLIMHRGDGSTGVHVGPQKARNAVKLYSKVQAYARSHGMDPPPDEKQIKQGYKRLLRVSINHPDLGKASAIKGDKIDYLKLTGVGQRLVTRIHTESNLKELAKSEAGLDVDAEPEPKWPEEYDRDDATVVMVPTEVVSDRDVPFQLPTHAEFECPICFESVAHEYVFEYPTQAWSDNVETECEACGSQLRHLMGHPYCQIEHIGQ
jgi:predicted nucleic acid-binding Zn ribbon protein